IFFIFRNENVPFSSRAELRKVPRLGDKAFEQCAGFLRIQGATNPLDASAVHPERYRIVEQMAKDCGCKVIDLVEQPERRHQIEISRYIAESVGLPTLQDILAELAKPGRDPRSTFSQFAFSEEINSIDDLQPGMRLPGLVTNVTKFGAFVDIGVHQDGLIHISQLADRYVKDPSEVVKVRQQVLVRVIEVDPQRKRIALSLKDG
ncbi:MAG: S1 RNA-binding domain-containing protein, partial [Desulfobulbaceae bacterium]|nr:S1 RNA-binding domain-containing protein [Desulfobulbaceae bacterium]